jgi:hypothetical protein
MNKCQEGEKIGNSVRKKQFGRPKHRWNDKKNYNQEYGSSIVCSSEKCERHNPGHHNKNIKLDFKEIAREGVNWIKMA